MLADASAGCAGGSVFPSLRDNLLSHTFKLKHAVFVQNLLNCVSAGEARKISCGYVMESIKVLAVSPPSEDQKNQHAAAAEVFGGMCQSVLSLDGDSKESWSFMLGGLDDILNIVFIDAVDDWADGLRFAIHRTGMGGLRPMLMYVKGKVEASLWRGGEGELDGGLGEEGFASQAKWLKLLQPVLIELFYVEPRVGLLECICGGEGGGEGVGVDVGALELGAREQTRQEFSGRQYQCGEEQRELISMVSMALLPRLLEAISHPFQKCRHQIAMLLHTVSGTTAGHRALGIEGGEYSASVVTAFVEQLSEADLGRKKNAREALCLMMLMMLHLGDARCYYKGAVVPLLESMFNCLEVAGEDGEDGEGGGGKEAESAKLCRSIVVILASRCLLVYDGAGEDVEKIVDIVGASCKSKDWQIRQAACVFLGRFFDIHKFLLGEAMGTRVFEIMTGLLGDERREVSNSATAGLTGCLAVMTDAEVVVLVEKFCGKADRSAGNRKRRKKAGGEGEGEEEMEREEKRVRLQRISVSVLCAALNSCPYDVPKFAPPAIEALSRHSFETAAPLGIREQVKSTLKAFKRTHIDMWAVHRTQFTQDQLDALADVCVSDYYA